jgi:hypothetical protein
MHDMTTLWLAVTRPAGLNFVAVLRSPVRFKLLNKRRCQGRFRRGVKRHLSLLGPGRIPSALSGLRGERTTNRSLRQRQEHSAWRLAECSRRPGGPPRKRVCTHSRDGRGEVAKTALLLRAHQRLFLRRWRGLRQKRHIRGCAPASETIYGFPIDFDKTLNLHRPSILG